MLRCHATATAVRTCARDMGWRTCRLLSTSSNSMVGQKRPVVDAHMHFWSFRTHCWLHDVTDETEIAGLKFRPLAIDYGPAEFRAEAADSEFELAACVHIEASADHSDFNAIGEARWLQAMGDLSPVGKGMPQAIVPFAPMGDFTLAETTLREHASLPNVRRVLACNNHG